MATTVVVVAMPADPASLVVDGGLSAEEMHVTLGFYGEATDVDDETVTALRKWVDQNEAAFSARVGGVARMGDDDPMAVTMLIEAQELADLRQSLETVADPDHTHPHFTPHITLGYGIDMPATVPTDVAIDRVELWVGDDHYPMAMTSRRAADVAAWLASAERRQAELAGRLG